MTTIMRTYITAPEKDKKFTAQSKTSRPAVAVFPVRERRQQIIADFLVSFFTLVKILTSVAKKTKRIISSSSQKRVNDTRSIIIVGY